MGGEQAEPPAPVETGYSSSELAQFQEAFDSLQESRDDIEGNTRFRDTRAEAYVDSKSAIVPFIFQRDGFEPILAVRIQYVGFSWIFWDSYIFALDDERISGSADYFDIKRDNSGGKVWEYYTFSDFGFSTTLEILEKIALSDSATLRLKGDDGSRDIQISDGDKQIAKTTADAFKWKSWEYENNG